MPEASAHLFTIQVRLALVLVASVGLIKVYHWLSRRRLGAGYGVLWSLVFAGMLVIAIFPVTVFWLAHLTGARDPEGGVRLLAFMFTFVMLLYMSVKTSILQRRLRDLTQALALRELEARRPAGGPGGEPVESGDGPGAPR